MKNFDDFGVYKRVPDKGQKSISCGWVITEKIYGDKVDCKARLVVHGNQLDEPVDTDSPTVRKLSLRVQFTLAAQYGWQVKTADVTAAFLQSDNLDRQIFVSPP